MQAQQKRILLSVGFLISALAIAGVMYLVFFKSDAPTPVQTTPNTSTPTGSGSGLPVSTDATTSPQPEPGPTTLPTASEVADGGLTQTTALTTGPVANTTIAPNGTDVRFYNKQDGKFYSIDPDGTVAKLSDQSFPNVQSVAWNKQSEKAVITFPDASKIVYNFATQTQVTLPRHWNDVEFAPNSNELIAKSLALDPNNRWLVTSSDTGANVVPIQALGQNGDKVQVNWSPNDQVVAFADTSSVNGADQLAGFDSRIIYPVGKNQENFKGLQVEGYGFSAAWSPSGKTILYSVYGDYSRGKPLLWLVDGTSATMGDKRRSVGLNTWVEKCTWSNETAVYCAVPQNLPDNAGMQPTLYASLPDTLYKINPQTNAISVVAIPEANSTMTNLSVSADQTLLYYTDGATQQLKLIKLK